MSEGFADRLAMWAMMDLPIRQLAGSSFCLRESLRIAMVVWPSWSMILTVGIMWSPFGRVLCEHGWTSTVDSGFSELFCVCVPRTWVVRWDGKIIDLVVNHLR